MRTLIFVLIIHTSADLGSLANDVAKRGIADLGEDLWKAHRMTIEGFWDAISHYFESLNVRSFKIYQDGLVADGELGLKIVFEGVKSGSKNYEIVSRLITRGAQLVKTENFSVVKKEYDYIVKITKARKFVKRILAALNYRFHKNKLLRERDEFIAQTIDNTLGQEEMGVLFLGAHHEIIPKLPKDIDIVELKKREKIKEYQKSFLSKKDNEKLNQLANYLISPIE